ncbi:hypothetical protein EDB83DRAFT_2522906 [Lactarius deliciosus]|nr:hypothetical protein EDB83DRAFT_2522906 [Lactarius deliciosus]
MSIIPPPWVGTPQRGSMCVCHDIRGDVDKKSADPLERAFLPTVRKPSPESESLSGTVGPPPLLDTPSALPLPACSYGPLHRAQEDSDLPPALGKRRGPRFTGPSPAEQEARVAGAHLHRGLSV